MCRLTIAFFCILTLLTNVAWCAGEAATPSAPLIKDVRVIQFNGRPVDVDLTEYLGGGKDCTALFQQLLDEAGKIGGQLLLPPGKFLVAGSIELPEGVTLLGSWGDQVHFDTTKVNTVLLLTGGKGNEDAPPAIRINGSAGLRGVTIAYPEQTFPDVIPYPWAISGDGYHIDIENITFVNAYNGIRLGERDSTLLLVRNVTGTVLRRGIFVNNCYDIGRLENILFNVHYFTNTDLPGIMTKGGKPNQDQVLSNYTRQHLEAYIIGKNDWGVLKDTFVYGAKIAYRFINTQNGSFNGKLEGIAADGSTVCISVESTNAFGILIDNGQFVSHPRFKEVEGMEPDWESAGGTAHVVIAPDSDCPVQFNDCTFFGASRNIARLEGKGFTSFSQCIFQQIWVPKDKASEPMLMALAGKLSVSQCQFLEQPGQTLPSVYLGPAMAGAWIVDNMATSAVRIENQLGAKAVIRDNDVPPIQSMTEPDKPAQGAK